MSHALRYVRAARFGKSHDVLGKAQREGQKTGKWLLGIRSEGGTDYKGTEEGTFGVMLCILIVAVVARLCVLQKE